MDDDASMDGALEEAFATDESGSVLERLSRLSGVESRVLLHEADAYESPMLRVPAARSDQGAEDDSRYQIVGEIARGGVGVVFKARDRDLGRDVALKVLRKEHAGRQEVLDRLIEEAQIGGQLQHPGIVPVYGLGLQADGRPHIAMKLVKGKTLASVLKERTSPDDARARVLRMFDQTCQTMAYAHARGVIHRDLKPTNIMIGGFGEVHVVDWGFGKVLGHDDPLAQRPVERTIVATVRSEGEGSQSIVGSVMGTPAYMPPEQALGQIEQLDERSDVFALGAILCEILTGEPPYVGEAKDRLMLAAQANLADAHARLDACTADPDLVALCRCAMSPLRADRPDDASVLATAIEEHLAAAEERARAAEVDAVREHARLERERQEVAWARGARRKTLAFASITIAAVVLAGLAWLRADADRRGRAQQLRTAAEVALADASRLLGAGQWSEAAAEAHKARDLAAQGQDLGGLCAEASGLVERAEAEARRLERRDRLLAALDEARLLRADDFDDVGTDERYASAMKTGGLDLAEMDPEEVAAAIQRDFPEAAEEIAAALDLWGWFRRNKAALHGRDWKKLGAVARRIDPAPWSSRLRDAVDASDLQALAALADEVLERGAPARTLDLLGLTLYTGGNREKGSALLEAAVALHPGDFWLQYHASTQSTDPHLAISHAAAALALRPGSAEVVNNLGVRLNDLGEVDAALDAFRRALSLQPDMTAAWANLCGVLGTKGDLEGAIAAGRKAVALEPESAGAHNNLARALSRRGDLHGALAEYQEALRFAPTSARVRGNLCSVLLGLGDKESALAHARKACELEPEDARCQYQLGCVLTALGRNDEALVAYREALRLDPAYAEAHVNAGVVLVGKSRIDEAETHLREAVRLEPELVQALCSLGYLLNQKHEYGKAIPILEKAVAIDERAAPAYLNLAVALGATGSLQAAADAYRKCLELAPGNAAVYVNMGNVLGRMGELDDAVEAYRRAIDLAPGMAGAHRNLGWTLIRKGESSAAVDALHEAIRLSPDSAEAYCDLGAALKALGRLEDALAAYRKGHELGSRDPDWSNPSARWIAEVEAMLAKQREGK